MHVVGFVVICQWPAEFEKNSQFEKNVTVIAFDSRNAQLKDSLVKLILLKSEVEKVSVMRIASGHYSCCKDATEH